MTAPADARRRVWCATLAKLVSPAFPADAAKALVDMLAALQDVPDSLFTDHTMKHVARAPRRQSGACCMEAARGFAGRVGVGRLLFR